MTISGCSILVELRGEAVGEKKKKALQKKAVSKAFSGELGQRESFLFRVSQKRKENDPK
jgi:hypothetical protein